MVRIEKKLFYPIPPTAPAPEFKGSTLLIPSVSIGNVPQLTCDLLIATLKLPLVGYLHSSYIYPAVGTKEGTTVFGRGGIACPLEVYFKKEKKLCIILQRTPYLSSAVKDEFVRELWNFTSCFGFAQVCLLASSDAARRTDEQIQGPRCQVLQVVDPNGERMLTSQLASITKSTPQTFFLADGKSRHFPQSGILRHFLRMAEDDKYSKREVLAVVIFASEGDNTADAEDLGYPLIESLRWAEKAELREEIIRDGREGPGKIAWVYPESWDKAFGDAPQVGAEGGLFW